ncbi:MAG: hypothetical protein KF718_06210 [Polyangiaceae bacterium]|nr:hypothetical protein [Polyangiaceae bacterium]
MPRRRLGGLLVPLMVLALGCEQTRGAGPQPPAGDLAVNAAAETVGITVPEEGAPESPNSFAVDASGRVHVLDQVGHQVLSFTPGSTTPKKTKLPARAFEDIELVAPSGDEGFLLLDLFVAPAVVFVSASGGVTNEVTLPKGDLPTPGRVAGLVRDEAGVWVQVETTHRVQIADAAGVPVESNVLPGVLTRASEAVSSTARANVIELFELGLPAGGPTPLGTLSFPSRVNHHALLGFDAKGSLLLAVTLEAAQADPDTPPTLSRRLLRLSPEGKEQSRADLPVAEGAHAGLRNVRLGADGNVYVMTATEELFRVSKVQP